MLQDVFLFCLIYAVFFCLFPEKLTCRRLFWLIGTHELLYMFAPAVPLIGILLFIHHFLQYLHVHFDMDVFQVCIQYVKGPHVRTQPTKNPNQKSSGWKRGWEILPLCKELATGRANPLSAGAGQSAAKPIKRRGIFSSQVSRAFNLLSLDEHYSPSRLCYGKGVLEELARKDTAHCASLVLSTLSIEFVKKGPL